MAAQIMFTPSRWDCVDNIQYTTVIMKTKERKTELLVKSRVMNKKQVIQVPYVFITNLQNLSTINFKAAAAFGNRYYNGDWNKKSDLSSILAIRLKEHLSPSISLLNTGDIPDPFRSLPFKGSTWQLVDASTNNAKHDHHACNTLP